MPAPAYAALHVAFKGKVDVVLRHAGCGQRLCGEAHHDLGPADHRDRFGRINFPNGDMVGHTGDLQATIEAMEVVDECVAKLMTVVDELGGILIYTADHGNADIMYTESDGVRSPKTSHTLSPVPFAIHDSGYGGEYVMAPPEHAGLSHVAATVLNLLGYDAPDDYQPSLIAFV